MSKAKGKRTAEKRLTRYTHDEAPETRVPETGHTSLLPGDEIVVTLGMDNGWSKAVEVGKLNAKADSRVIVDMDPIHDPTVFWAGKMNRREIAVLPLQRNEIVSDSRIGQIIERARRLASTGKGQAKLTGYFSDLEKALRENDKEKRVEFYSHDGGWKNKLVCGDSLQVMESLVHYEGLRGKVQMMYIDPPYGIAYDSNFQQRIDSTKNDDKDKADDVLTIKAFRDTWALGIHSYLSYLQERLYLCRELLSESGSIFVQMNQETAHLVRAILDEVFGAKNFVSLIVFTKTGGQSSALLSGVYDLLLWYAKDKDAIRYNQIYLAKEHGGPGTSGYTFVENPDGTEWRPMTAMEQRDPSSIPAGWRVFDGTPLASAGEAKGGPPSFEYLERRYTTPPNSHWKTTAAGMRRLAEKNRIIAIGTRIEYKRYF